MDIQTLPSYSSCSWVLSQRAGSQSSQWLVARLGRLPASEGLWLTQERSNSAGSPPQPATAIYPLSTFLLSLLQRALEQTLYVLFLQTNRVWLWKERQTWSRKPSWAASTGSKIYLKSVSMETRWCLRAAWRPHKAFCKTIVYYYHCFTYPYI